MNSKENSHNFKLMTLLNHVRYQAKEETRIEVAECMLDYGIDIKLVGAVTGLKMSQITHTKKNKV
ncbi:hypothetical protein [Bacillus solitudinis]|uniref:hypothetical protein n=1 Tax=Bacillus solitudinis TaxID=2014074 RepID=UPI000C243C22|nr:hypothetical protein [Bacillus solitudinis]